MQDRICDPKIIMKDLNDVLGVFKAHGVTALLSYGAVLGAIREKDFIKWDDDIDLSVVEPISYRTRKSIGWMLFDLGFKPQPIGFNVYGRMEPTEVGYIGDGETGIIVCERGFKFSIFFFKEEDCPEHGKEMVCTPKMGAIKLLCSPSRFYQTPGTVKLYGKTFLTPGPVLEYLEWTYGDWKTPKKDNAHAPQYQGMHPGYREKYEQGLLG